MVLRNKPSQLMRMKNTLVFRLITLVILLLAIVACNRPTPTFLPTPTASPTNTATPLPPPTAIPTSTPALVQDTIRIWHALDEGSLSALVQIISDFQVLYPDVLFDVLYIPFEDLKVRYESALREGDGPSLLMGPAEWGASLYEAGWVMDLSGLVEEDVIQPLSKAALGNVRYRQALLGLPYNLRGVVLYRNTALISSPPLTFDDLISSAQAATQGEIIGADLERSFFFSGGHLLGLGGEWLGLQGEPAFVTEQGTAWLELLRDFSRAGPTEFLSDRDLELFKQGRVGFIIDGTWNMLGLLQALGPGNVAIDPWPAYKTNALSGFVQSDNLYLNPSLPATQRNAALNFMQFFLSAPAQVHLAKSGLIPVISNLQVADAPSGELLNQALVALAGGSAYPIAPQIAAYPGLVDVSLKAALMNKTPAGQVLLAMAQAIQSALATTPNPLP